MKLMKVLLWITAIGCLLAIPFIFFPWSLTMGIMSGFGVEEIPYMPTVVYTLKICFGIIGLIGIFYIILALDPMEHGQMMVLGTVGLIIFGVLALVLGLINNIANIVFIGDTVVGIILGGAILLLYMRQRIVG